MQFFSPFCRWLTKMKQLRCAKALKLLNFSFIVTMSTLQIHKTYPRGPLSESIVITLLHPPKSIPASVHDEALKSSLSGSLDDYIIHTNHSGLQINATAKKPYQECYRSAEERLSTVEKRLRILENDILTVEEKLHILENDKSIAQEKIHILENDKAYAEYIFLRSQICSHLLSSKFNHTPSLMILS